MLLVILVTLVWVLHDLRHADDNRLYYWLYTHKGEIAMKRKHNLQAVLNALGAHLHGIKKQKFDNAVKHIAKQHFFTERNRCTCCGRLNHVHGGDLGPKCAKGQCGCK